ncbi:VOC family protein [Cryptosporangium arvum]|uniref:Lactoylglutathione lyase family protein n=1 Tax=Cryptosporangium arvum DSM 44712 TaxID=927661 RepID=A0A010ZS41_9ACTN|nr:VOC family protein [Cryptosporangium arvum]EXG81484.1 lactoylglutathione lyase family protein [Cryptosporangium arvum DSM 44712]
MATGVASVWVPVDDMERAVGFYRDVLGLELTDQQPQWSELDAGGLRIGLNAREGVSQHADGGAVISFRPDDDLESEVDRLRGAGVRFTGDISDHEWGRIVPFKDSEGNDLQLYAPPKN